MTDRPVAEEAASPAPLVGLLRSLRLDAAELERLAPLVKPPPEAPTFTVIVRTQGRRPRSLLEAVRSLAEQTWRDFETLVSVHGDEGAVARVEAALDTARAAGTAPPDCRVVPVSPDGSRARPLNAGLDAAAGDYVTFLDDDDLAEPHWLAVFARASGDAAGKVIRARTARQPWSASGTAEPQQPSGPVEYIYPATFDLLAHFAYSETPICSIALPRRLLVHFGLRLDEDLTVCEDWDLLIRAALILGVHCVDETTSLYRRSDSANSQTEADMHEWRRNREIVIEKLAGQPFVLDGPAARRLAEAHFDYEGGPGARLEYVKTLELLAALPKRLRARLVKTLGLRRRGSGRR